MPEVIKFYIREESYGFLSNFWRCRQGSLIKYPTNEHYYQANKPNNPDLYRWIASAPTAYAAMMAGRSLKPNEIREDWDEIKEKVMLEGLRMKFEDESLRLMLLWTGDAILIEDSPIDMFWGGSLEGSKNMLGKLLMQVRDEIRGTC